tara:strand:+ start:395 stop:604 length:210 start_codon:yes stop_codon:yes gene_type:complete
LTATITAERWNYDTQKWEILEVDANLLSLIAWQGTKFTSRDEEIVNAAFEISETAKNMNKDPDENFRKN